MRLPHPPLLLVTDRSQAVAALEAILDAAFAAGCRWASVREKDLPNDAQVALARALHRIAQRHGATFTLHGSAELAAAAGVDGVHLAAGSDAAAARRKLGPRKLVGVSVHAPAEAAGLDPAAADYLIAGPAFETLSKPGYGPTLGEAGIAAVAAASRVPVLAIGGVGPENAAKLLAAGAAGLAVMGQVMRSADPGAEIRALLAAVQAGQRPCVAPPAP